MSADTEFVFDAVVGFLTSPIWNVPVLTFIEQNCLVFDAEAQNQNTYKEIHEQYKTTVETLLSSVLKDFGITEEQFMQACSSGGNNAQFNGVHREVFEQMWAAEDFEVFKRLMLQKNIELQLQALHLIQQRNNVIPPSMTTGGPFRAVPPRQSSESTRDGEDAIMQEVLKRSKEEYEMQQKILKDSEMELEKSVAHSSVDESARLMEEAQREHEKLKKALKISIEAQSNAATEAEKLRDETKKESSKPVTKPGATSTTKVELEGPANAASKQASLPALKPTKAAQKASTAAKQGKTGQTSSNSAEPNTAAKQGKTGQTSSNSAEPNTAAAREPKREASSDAASNWFSSAKAEASAAGSQCSAATTQNIEMTEEELARRTEYLKNQRDKLLELKKQQRQKRLTTYTEQQPSARPTSARAARRVTDGEQVESPASKPSQGDKEKKLAMRRALADCLKREVVDKN